MIHFLFNAGVKTISMAVLFVCMVVVSQKVHMRVQKLVCKCMNDTLEPTQSNHVVSPLLLLKVSYNIHCFKQGVGYGY